MAKAKIRKATGLQTLKAWKITSYRSRTAGLPEPKAFRKIPPVLSSVQDHLSGKPVIASSLVIAFVVITFWHLTGLNVNKQSPATGLTRIMAKYIHSQKIPIAELEVGMYVTGLSVPWSATEFPLQGLRISTPLDIIKVARYGDWVVIDQARSLLRQPAQQEVSANKLPTRRNTTKTALWKKLKSRQYQQIRPMIKELKAGRELLQKLEQSFESVWQSMRDNQPLDVSELQQVNQRIVDSVLESPDALIWLTRVKAQSGQIYQHGLRCAIWASLTGRSMGLQKESIRALTLALMLAGIGKAKLGKSYWKSHNPTNPSINFLSCFQFTLQQITHSKVDNRVRIIIANMGERFNGTGQPSGKLDNNIPYLAQIASLVETFDLIIHPPGTTKKRTVATALSRLYYFRDALFDSGLIEAFIAGIGLYPTGTQVQLSNGYRGVVVEQSKERRIRATVAITHDADNYRLLDYQIARLGEGDYKDVTIASETSIHHILEDDMARINQLIVKKHGGALSKLKSLWQ